jgi:hypothetical protein
MHIFSPDLRPLRFFLYQAVAITLEDAIITLAKRAGLKNSIFYKVLGYAWVYCCLFMTLAPWLDSLNAIGMGGSVCILGGFRDK